MKRSWVWRGQLHTRFLETSNSERFSRMLQFQQQLLQLELIR